MKVNGGRMTRRTWLAAGAALTLGACSKGRGPLDINSLEGGWVGAHLDRGHAWRDGRFPISTSSGPVHRSHVVVVGAGVGGLSAARALRRAGVDDLVVLDLEDQVGGNARSHEMRGLPCPLGAHYLPVPGAHAQDVAQWLEEIAVISWQRGRWQADERYLCHSLQERLFVPHPSGTAYPSGIQSGQWQDGLLPWPDQAQARTPAWRQTLEQYRRFGNIVNGLRQAGAFAIPTRQAVWGLQQAELDGVTFSAWLDAQGLNASVLRWYLDYVCRDDYGAGASQVSAWAGLHYFASRHGFALPGQASEDTDSGVLTWPEGNAWLVRQLAQGLGDRWHAGEMALQVKPGRHDVTVATLDIRSGQPRTYVAQYVVLAVPLFVAARLLDPVPAALQALAAHLHYAPWLVSNLFLEAPLLERVGAPLAWDNVNFSSVGGAGVHEPSLGYVDARHQSLAPTPGAQLLTHYWALGGQSHVTLSQNRQRLLSAPWQDWARSVIDDMRALHPDLSSKLRRIDLMRWGHAMLIPVPGLRAHPALAALNRGLDRVQFAHSDLAAYSVFEEAFTAGVRASEQMLSTRRRS